MELNQKQLQTIKDLQYKNPLTPREIFNWCYIKISQPHQTCPRKPNHRKWGIQHYQGIADYFEKQGIK